MCIYKKTEKENMGFQMHLKGISVYEIHLQGIGQPKAVVLAQDAMQ